jgi:chaperonin cofactor prefoldin
MLTPEEKIIEQLESDIERLKLEIFELKGDNKILKGQLKEATIELQKNQGFYDDDGNYIE